MQPIRTGFTGSLAMTAIGPTTDATSVADDAPWAAPVADATVAEEPALNAVLIASLPQSALDAFLPANTETAREQPAPSLWQTFGATGAGPWRDTPGDGTLFGGEWIRQQSLKGQARSGARGAAGDVTIGAAATAQNLTDRARNIGLSPSEVAQLQAILRDGRFEG